MTEPLDLDALRAAAADAYRVLNDPCMRGKAVAPMTVRGLLAGIGALSSSLATAKAERDAALAELAALRAQVEASTARARDAITEDATS